MDFERALAAHADPGYENYRKGFELIYRQLENILSKKGLEQIDAEGKPFDPHLHHAVERIESSDYPDGTVVGVMQIGIYISRESFAAGDGAGDREFALGDRAGKLNSRSGAMRSVLKMCGNNPASRRFSKI